MKNILVSFLLLAAVSPAEAAPPTFTTSKDVLVVPAPQTTSIVAVKRALQSTIDQIEDLEKLDGIMDRLNTIDDEPLLSIHSPWNGMIRMKEGDARERELFCEFITKLGRHRADELSKYMRKLKEEGIK